MPNLHILYMEFENTIVMFPRIYLIAKLCAKIKILKFGTKNVLFWYFWAGI